MTDWRELAWTAFGHTLGGLVGIAVVVGLLSLYVQAWY